MLLLLLQQQDYQEERSDIDWLGSSTLPPVGSPLSQDQLDSFLERRLAFFPEVPQLSHGIPGAVGI
eukprot:UN08434